MAMNAVLVLLLLPSAHSIALRAAWGRAIGVVAPVVHHFVEPHQLQATTLDRLTNVAIPSDEGREVLAFAARPADGSTGPRPVLVLLHEFFGLSESIVDKAQGLADELGCLVVAPDVFRGVTTDFIPRAIWLALSTPQPRVNADIDAVLRWAAAGGPGAHHHRALSDRQRHHCPEHQARAEGQAQGPGQAQALPRLREGRMRPR